MLPEQWMRNSYHNQLCGCWRLSGTQLGRLRFPIGLLWYRGMLLHRRNLCECDTGQLCFWWWGVPRSFRAMQSHALSFANRSLLPWRLVHLFGGSNLSGCRGRVQRRWHLMRGCARVHWHRRLLLCRCLLHQRNAGKLLLWWRYFPGLLGRVCHHRLPPVDRSMLCWIFLRDP